MNEDRGVPSGDAAAPAAPAAPDRRNGAVRRLEGSDFMAKRKTSGFQTNEIRNAAFIANVCSILALPGARRSVRRCGRSARSRRFPDRPSDGGRSRAAPTRGAEGLKPEAWRRARRCPRTPTYIAGGSGMTHRGPPPGQGGEPGAAGPIAGPRRRCAGGEGRRRGSSPRAAPHLSRPRGRLHPAPRGQAPPLPRALAAGCPLARVV